VIAIKPPLGPDLSATEVAGAASTPVIRLVGVEKALGGQPVLKGVNLEIPRGRVTTVIGKSGGGKSVLLKHIIGLMKPDRGQVLVDDMDIVRMGSRELNDVRKKLAMLFQGSALFDSLTVVENVAFPLYEKTKLPDVEIERKVLEMLEAVGLTDMGHKFPAELSGGMRKRAGLARALVMGPEIILFDEPTTGLDPLLAQSIHELIIETQQRFGFTAVMVSHEIPEIFGFSDYVAMLLDGVIVEMAPPNEFQNTQNPVVQEFISVGRRGHKTAHEGPSRRRSEHEGR
jgi:phospholipid/cholesterol/gamma-HCH transport system ATP-binding protein